MSDRTPRFCNCDRMGTSGSCPTHLWSGFSADDMLHPEAHDKVNKLADLTQRLAASEAHAQVPVGELLTDRDEQIQKWLDRAQEAERQLAELREREKAQIAAAYQDAKNKFKQLANDVYHDKLICTFEEAVENWQPTPADAQAALAEQIASAEARGRREAAKVCDDHAEELIAMIGQPLPPNYGPEDMRLRDVRVKAQAYTARICSQRISERIATLEKQKAEHG